MKIPAISTDQMREVDRLMIEVYGIELIQMMENAGRNLAVLARGHFLKGELENKRVLVLAGSGGNGGGGLVAARWLSNWGANVQICTTILPVDFVGIPGHQLMILNAMSLPVSVVSECSELPDADLILDAIIGYSLRGAPQSGAADLIQKANECGAPILSLDIPSGIDATSGQAFDPHIRAKATLTLALPKIGLLNDSVKGSIGDLFLADICVPPQLYTYLGLRVGNIFAEHDFIKIKSLCQACKNKNAPNREH